MVETKTIFKPINTQPLQPIIDVTFWQHFTKLKLDTWKLNSPRISVVGSISLPNNVSAAQDLVLSQ